MNGVMLIILIPVFWIAPIFVARAIGKGKGKESSWVWGLLLGWLGVLIVALQSRPQAPVIIRPASPTPMTRAAAVPTVTPVKLCPQCAEHVQSAARICRYCGYNFESSVEAGGG